MTAIFKQVTKNENVGFVCDKCGETIDRSKSTRTDDFSINYTCGYGTENDMTVIRADICDNCLVDIFSREIPGSIK